MESSRRKCLVWGGKTLGDMVTEVEVKESAKHARETLSRQKSVKVQEVITRSCKSCGRDHGSNQNGVQRPFRAI